MALVFVPKVLEIIRTRQNLASGLNGTFNETMSSKEEEERLVRLSTENEELKMKISEKERQIDDVKKKIEQLTKEQIERKLQQERAEQLKTNNDTSKVVPVARAGILKKAVRIQEPEETVANREKAIVDVHSTASDSGFVPATIANGAGTSKTSETDLSGSYL